MKTVDFSYFIERYNANEMNDAEKQWFRRELEGNPDLRKEVELWTKTDNVLNDHAAFLLRNKLRTIEKQRTEAVAPKNSRKHLPVKYAAVITIFILLGALFFLSDRNLSKNEILDRFYKSYEGISASRSQVSSIADTDYEKALEYYNVHDFSNAALYFNKVLRTNPGDMESTLLYGVSNFEEKNFPVAKQSFNKVVDNNDNLYMEDAQWYLALCYLQTDESEKAAEQLTLIRNSESIYRKDARKILRRMK